jgi:ketosteroid isomerase-like protein
MLLIPIAATLVSVLAPADAAVPESTRAEVTDMLRSLEDQWIGVYATHDLSVLHRIIADDFVATLADGAMRRKREHIEAYKADFESIAAVTSGEVEVHVYQADAAVVTGLYTATLREPKGAVPGRFRFTDTWLRRGGVWRCVATHENKLE